MNTTLIAFLLAVACYGQSSGAGLMRLQTTIQTFSSVSTGASIDVADRDHLFHLIFFTHSAGAVVTSCTVTMEQSKNAGVTWEPTFVSSDCTSDGTTSNPGFIKATLVRLNVSAFVSTGTMTAAHVVYADATGMTPKVYKVANAVSCAAEVAAWTPPAGKRFRLLSALLSTSVAGNVLLRDGTAGTIFGVIPMPVLGPAHQVSFGAYGFISGANNRVLTLQGPVLALCSGTLMGLEE